MRKVSKNGWDLEHLRRVGDVATAIAPNLSPARQGALPNGSLLPGEDKFCICVTRGSEDWQQMQPVVEMELFPVHQQELFRGLLLLSENNSAELF